MFVMLTMITGDLWTRLQWGVWWEWEPRLTTYFIMTLLVIALLRAAQLDRGRGAPGDVRGGLRHHRLHRRADLVLHHARAVPSAATRSCSAAAAGLGPTPQLLVTFIIAQVGMLMLGYAIYPAADARGVAQGAPRGRQGRSGRLESHGTTALDASTRLVYADGARTCIAAYALLWARSSSIVGLVLRRLIGSRSRLECSRRRRRRRASAVERRRQRSVGTCVEQVVGRSVLVRDGALRRRDRAVRLPLRRQAPAALAGARRSSPARLPAADARRSGCARSRPTARSSTGPNSLVLAAWALVLVYFVVEHVVQLKVYGTFLVPLVGAAARRSPSSWASTGAAAELDADAGRSSSTSWRVGIHVALIVFANAGFASARRPRPSTCCRSAQLKRHRTNTLLPPAALARADRDDRAALDRARVSRRTPPACCSASSAPSRPTSRGWWADPRVMLAGIVWVDLRRLPVPALPARTSPAATAAGSRSSGSCSSSCSRSWRARVPAGFHVFGV